MNKTRHACAFCLCAVLLASACSKSDGPATAPAVAPRESTATPVAPSANAPASGHVVTLANGADLALVKNQEMIHPQFGLTPPDVVTPIIFAVVQNADETASSPVLLKKFGSTWKVIKLDEADFQEWVYAAAVAGKKELWGILDVAGESHADKLTLVRSTDDGQSWTFFSALKKPTPEAEYAGFSMAKSGEGRLSLHIEDDTDTLTHGYYHYKTSDGGKTWTGPTVEGDDITQADSLSDIDTLQEAIKNAESVPPSQQQ